MFFKKKTADEHSLAWLNADMHSHLLPGIDDGSPDLATSIALVRGLAALGYKKLITTPHILWDLYRNTAEQIRYAEAALQQAIESEGLDISLKAAAEYYIDEHFQQELAAKTPLLTLGDNFVLVEFSMMTAPMDLQEVLFEMQMQNYQPVIAHPERYVYMNRRREFFDGLKSSGCLFQLNLMALGGYYGAGVHELAEHLLKKEYYDFAGTDLHHAKHLDALKKIPASSIRKLQETGRIKNHLL